MAPLVPTTLGEVSSPAEEQIMLEDSQPMTVEYAKSVYYHESECDMKFDRSE